MSSYGYEQKVAAINGNRIYDSVLQCPPLLKNNMVVPLDCSVTYISSSVS